MASKKVKKSSMKKSGAGSDKSGQSYVDRYNASLGAAYSRVASEAAKVSPKTYSGPEGAKRFSESYKSNRAWGGFKDVAKGNPWASDIGVKSVVQRERRKTSGDISSVRAESRKRTRRK
jgi:hypothetical protein